MRHIRIAAAAALLATSAISAPALATPTAQQKLAAKALVKLSQLNLTVLNDWQFNGGGEVEGKVWVGRDALGNGPTQIGFGASNGQGTLASSFASVTVGRNSSIGYQITNAVGGAYGAYVVGNQTGLVTLSNVGGAINIGGNATQTLSFGAGAVINVIGSVSQNLGLSANNVINVGTVNGAIQGGSNTTVNVRGNVQGDISSGTGATINVSGKVTGKVNGGYSVKVGNDIEGGEGLTLSESGATAAVGGKINGKLTMTSGTSATVVGSVGQDTQLGDNAHATIGGSINKGTIGSGSSLKVVGTSGEVSTGTNSTAQLGGSASKVNLGNGSTATVRGDVQNGGNIGSSTLVVLGNASSIDIGGGGKLYAGGSINNGNNNGGTRYANYNFATPGGPAAPTAPTAPIAPTGPTVPVIGGIAVSNMTSEFAALSDVLKNLSTVGHLGTITQTNGVAQNAQAYTFSTGSSTGYTVFNVSETIFNLNEFAYNFANQTTPVIINVKNSNTVCSTAKTCSYNINSTFTGNVALNNRNVIWNFVDAQNIVIQKQFQGSIISYLADLQSNVIEGSVVAKNFTQTNEIHLGTFNRNDGNSFLLTGVVPEPANWAMMIAGFGMIGGAIRRRRTFAVAA